MEKRPDVYAPKLLHYIVVFPLYILIKLLMASIRFKYSKETQQKCSNPSRLLGVGWHSDILFIAKSKIHFRKNLTMSGLVSASRDAAYLVAFFNLMGIRSIRGSQKRRGREAIHDLVEALKTDSDAFITPDGPKGPSHIAKKGFYVVAESAGCRILLMRYRPKHFFTIPTWDKFIVPYPFTRVKVEVLDFENAKALEKVAKDHDWTPEEFVSNFCNATI